MQKIKVSAVSFINSIPLVYGLRHPSISNRIILSLDTPSAIAHKLKNHDVSIGLVPVAAIPEIDHLSVLTGYCIGAKQNVRTVLLVSPVPIHEIRNVLTDPDSRTSNKLAEILFTHYWKSHVHWQTINQPFNRSLINGHTAAIIIGDKCFEWENQFPYQYDLAEEWRSFTGLSFVFACWATVEKLDSSFIKLFNSSLEYGIQHFDESAEFTSLPQTKQIIIRSYLTTNISYSFDDEKIKAMQLFLQLSTGYRGKVNSFLI